MVGFGRNVNVLAALKSYFFVAAHNVSGAAYYYPVLATPRVPLQAKPRAGFYFKYLHLEPGFSSNTS
jgi:hypothetical protein